MTEERYTHGHVEPVLRSQRWRTAENSAGYLLPELRPGMSLLDVGCGPGNITRELAQQLAPGRVVGVDGSAEVIAQAAAPPAVVPVEWQVADAYALPFDDGTFSVAHAHQVLQHVADPVAALVEMARVVEPGGLVAARDSDYGSWTWYPELPELDRWLEVYSAVARANAGEPNAGRFLQAWARRAGMQDVATSVTSWCFSTPADVAWWGAMWAERAVTAPFARRAVDLDIAGEPELEELAGGWRRWAADPDAYLSVPSTEILCRVPS
jgi:ubiquinone/menaquinone biosynthesis C-methylase UbiE